MRKAIGILGGLGPAAGADLFQKIISLSPALCDQDHFPVLLFSLPGEISGRPDYLFDRQRINPGLAMGEIMAEMTHCGASVLGIPCNTAHSPEILKPALEIVRQKGAPCEFISILAAEANFIREKYPRSKVGVLCTEAAYRFELFQNSKEFAGIELLFPNAEGRRNIQNAISHSEFGIKVQANPITEQAARLIQNEISTLAAAGADLILLACSELPLAYSAINSGCLPIIDGTELLAKALMCAFKHQSP